MSDFCLIISGSPECYIPPQMKEASLIIACDSGYMHAVRAGILPDIVVGDFDSYTGAIAPGIQVVRAPAEKDDTDTFMALKTAIDIGYRNVVITGALGARMDHAVANISITAFAAENGVMCQLIDRHHQIFAIKNRSVKIAGKNWRRVSVFAMDKIVRGVTLRGLKYPLADAELSNTFPIGVSNEFLEEQATVSVNDGTLLIVLTDSE